MHVGASEGGCLCERVSEGVCVFLLKQEDTV